MVDYMEREKMLMNPLYTMLYTMLYVYVKYEQTEAHTFGSVWKSPK